MQTLIKGAVVFVLFLSILSILFIDVWVGF